MVANNSMLLSIALAVTILTALLSTGADAGSNSKRRSQQQNLRYDNQEHKHTYKGFSSGEWRHGQEYRFHYDVQTSSGYAPWISAQRAVGRMQSDVLVKFHSENCATLRLENIEERERHFINAPWNSAEIMPINVFENTQRQQNDTDEMISQLELPVEFNFEDGKVSNVQFSSDEETWSKNIKKAILSLIQLNIKQQDIESVLESKHNTRKSFTQFETTIEGECENLYVLSKADNDYEQNDRKAERVNLTKTINFERCNKLADITYGMQVENNRYEAEINESDEQKPTIQRGALVPSEKLERSSIYRYQLAKENEQLSQFGIVQVDVVSQYTLKSLISESMQTPHTVVASRLRFVERTENNKKYRNLVGKKSDPETLLYNTDVELFEKLFVMFGDEKFADSKQLSWERHQATQYESKKLVNELAKNFNEQYKTNGGVDTLKTVQEFRSLAQILRYATSHELKNLKKEFDSKVKRTIFVDALAAAASRNTIKFLVDLIQNQDEYVDTVKSVQLLKSFGIGYGLPAPSEKQTDLVLGLCKSDSMKKTHRAALRQTCWLTFGSMVHELVEQARKSKEIGSQIKTPMYTVELDSISEHKMTLYKDVIFI